MILYFIKHKPTGHYLANFSLREYLQRGTHLEPHPEKPARIFRTEQAAKIALTYWLRGRATEDQLESVPGRRRQDMEIVAVEVTLP